MKCSQPNPYPESHLSSFMATGLCFNRGTIGVIVKFCIIFLFIQREAVKFEIKATGKEV